MLLKRDQILSSDDLKYEDVEVPEWGGAVRISVMSGVARDAWEQTLVPKVKGAGPDITNIRARLVAACAVDEGGRLLFSEKDVAALGAKSGIALERCAKVAQRLNGLTDRDVEEAGKN